MNDIDEPCAVCGNTEISNDWTAHWDHPYGTFIAAWSCSQKCHDIIESRRSADRVLAPQQ